MNRLLKLLIALGVIGAVAVLITTQTRKRASAPRNITPTPWKPPVVDRPEADPAVTDAAEEGMTPPPGEPAVDVALGSSGELLVSELSVPGATEPAQLTDAQRQMKKVLARAENEGMEPPPNAPPKDIAIGSDGAELISELAPPGAEEALLAARTEPPAEELAVASAEGMLPADGGPADAAVGSSGEVLVSEFAAPAAALDAPAASTETSAPENPDFDAIFREAEEAGQTASPADGESGDSDFLTEYFDKLAATPDEELAAEEAARVAPPEAVDAPAAAPAPAPPSTAPSSEEHLLSSVEEALGDLEPTPITAPPRRTAESYLDEGNVYFNVGQYGLAIDRYGQAIEMDNNLTAAFYNRANAHTRAGEFDKALADYDRALELHPLDADALNNRGMLHLYRANYANALSDFNRALELDPSDTTVMVNRGLAQLHGGNAAAALVDFREATEMDPVDAAAQYGAAQAAASMNNRDEAIRYVARALELDPGYAREAAGDPRLGILAGDDAFLKLLRESGSRSN